MLPGGRLLAALAGSVALLAGCASLPGEDAPVLSERAEVERVMASLSELRGLTWKRDVPVELAADRRAERRARRARAQAAATSETSDAADAAPDTGSSPARAEGGARGRRRQGLRAEAYALLGFLEGVAPPSGPSAVTGAARPADVGNEGPGRPGRVIGQLHGAVRETAAAFYDVNEQTIVVREGALVGGDLEEMILVHELGHALDDQYHSLARVLDGAKSFDALLAARCAIEGAAQLSVMLTMGKIALEPEGRDRLERLAERGREQAGRTARRLADRPALVRGFTVLPYTLGTRLLASRAAGGRPALQAARDGEPSALNALIAQVLTDPPRTMEQVLHPARYWTERAEPRAVELSDDVVTALGDGWRAADSDTLGEFALFLALTDEALDERSLGRRRALAAIAREMAHTGPAEGWDGDRYLYCRGPDGRQALVWLSYWDRTADRDEALSAATSRLPRKSPAFRLARPVADDGLALYFLPDEDEELLGRLIVGVEGSLARAPGDV